MTATRTIYFGMHDDKSDSHKYVFYQTFSSDGEGGRFGSGLSLDHLTGYLEGTSSGMESITNLKNGIPEKYKDMFEGMKIKPITREDLDKILQETELAAFYPDL